MMCLTSIRLIFVSLNYTD